ncbi:hypothetical protein RSOLAG22IIIB_10897 [Rhizoctonia solani]|uniref:Uncharacterized protein n=1 Tax=Rhizoctonia solani TaxID=456999 RepID=A0A0K6G578_9AGAM|nr:hypothetical protein RSOLAG22IIIB_10897 [Rhizoctonia solani]
MIFLPLACYTSALVSLRPRLCGAYPDQTKPPPSWDRAWLVGWCILSIVATIQRYLVVVVYTEDALSSFNGCIRNSNAAVLALCSLGLFEICAIISIAIRRRRSTVTLDESPTADTKKAHNCKDLVVSNV